MKKIFILFGLLFIFNFGISNALLLDFVDLNVQGLKDKFSSVHFIGPGNDFGGAFFWLSSKSLPIPQKIDLNNGEVVNCYKQVRGLYYNNQRGEVIWPLDVYTLRILRKGNSSYSGLTLLGGLYSTCDKDPYSIFGQITFTYSGTSNYLMAGLGLDYKNNRFEGVFKNNFQYFNNDLPLGYIFDDLGGIAFVGGLLTGDGTTSNTGHECLNCILNNNCSDFSYCNNIGTENCTGTKINDFFNYSGSVIISNNNCPFYFTGATIAGGPGWGINIKGKIGLSRELEDIERKTLIGNQEKAILLSTPNITSSTLVNQIRKISQKLCRGRPNYTSINLPIVDDVVLCFNYPTYLTSNTLTIDLNNISSYQGKTIIVKNANVLLKNSMINESNFLDIFVDNGNIFLDNNLLNLQRFDGNGYFSTAINGVTQGLFLQGNFIINGLLLAKDNKINNYKHKLYFHGKLYTLNTPVFPSTGRITQIKNLFSTGIFNTWIDLQSIFNRYCDFTTGSGSDGVICSEDPLAQSPLVIVDKLFPSRLLGTN